jgi:hypothetical protein
MDTDRSAGGRPIDFGALWKLGSTIGTTEKLHEHL